MDNNELLHYGVLGMKWGVRKNRGSSKSSGRAKKEKRAVDPSYEKAHSKTNVKYLNDNDLRDINNRLNAERQYKDLKKQQRVGKKAVDAFVKSGKTIAAVTAAVAAYQMVGKKFVKPVVEKLIHA